MSEVGHACFGIDEFDIAATKDVQSLISIRLYQLFAQGPEDLLPSGSQHLCPDDHVPSAASHEDGIYVVGGDFPGAEG